MTTPTKATLAEAIQAHLGTPQAETARRLGLTRQAWHRYLTGASSPSIATAEGWLDALGLTPTRNPGEGWRVR